jgi:hypothetical protein
MRSVIREFKLAGAAGDGRHAYLNNDGAFIGRGVPLLERDPSSRWRPRDQTVLERLLAKGYGVPVELGWRMTQLRNVAHALNSGDLALASISLVHTKLPPLPSSDHAREMAEADGLLLKYNPNWGTKRALLEAIPLVGNGRAKPRRLPAEERHRVWPLMTAHPAKQQHLQGYNGYHRSSRLHE